MRHAIFLDRLKDLKMCRTIFKKRGGQFLGRCRPGRELSSGASGLRRAFQAVAGSGGADGIAERRLPAPPRPGSFRVTRGLHGSREGLRVGLPASILALTPSARKTPAPNRNNNVAGLRGLSWLTILLIARFLPGYLPLL